MRGTILLGVLANVYRVNATTSCTGVEVEDWGGATGVVDDFLSCVSAGVGNYTVCLADTVTNYDTMSSGCKTCTTEFFRSTGATCFIECLLDDGSDECETCTPEMRTNWTIACDGTYEASRGSAASIGLSLTVVASALLMAMVNL